MFKFRGYNAADDFNFIINSWLKSYRNAVPSTDIPNTIYFDGQTDRITSILRSQDTVGMIVCAEDDPDQIMAYMVFDNKLPIVHYIYVKNPFRRRGIAKMLMGIAAHHHKDKILHLTHHPKKLAKLSKLFKVVFNPYAFIQSLSDPNQYPESDSSMVQN